MRKWSASDDELIRLGYASAVPVVQIAAVLGGDVTRSMVCGRAQRLGIVHPKMVEGRGWPSRWVDWRVVLIELGYLSGRTVECGFNSEIRA